MVGGFSNRYEIDLETERLELKEEYLGVGEISCMLGQLLVIFNTETTVAEMYPYYYSNGLHEIFNVVSI